MGAERLLQPLSRETGAERPQNATGKWAECWDANTGLRASCPNIQPKNVGPKVRHDFQFLAYCVEYTSFFKQKMHDRFRLLAMKLPLQKRSEAKEILLVPTDAAQNPIIGPDLSEPSAYLPPPEICW